jgi:AcrR family transcriptional regulator
MRTEPRARQIRASARRPLTADTIVTAALDLIDRDGSLSMRRLGSQLGVDPMAVYHHIDNRDTLVALMLERVLTGLQVPSPDLPWEERIRTLAHDYRQLVIAHRTLTYESLGNPVVVARVAPDASAPLIAAIVDAGVPEVTAGQLADLVVDYVHGHALAIADAHAATAQARAFELAIDTIVDGIRARWAQSRVE